MRSFSILAVLLIVLASCKKTAIQKPEPLPAAEPAGYLDIHIDNVINNQPLALTTSTYTNANNDTFNVDILKYYISNVQLKTSTGFVYVEPESYYLVNQENSASLHLKIKRVPANEYSSISFIMGVDSSRNVYGSFTGALDPVHNMYWSWNQGFIMAKLEGHSPQSTEPNHKIVYHIGGYAGKFNGVRSINLLFPNTANVTTNHTPTLNLKADIATWFVNPTPLDFSVDWGITGIDAASSNIADNYATMFSVTSVIN